MLTPAEEMGLSGLSLASRVRKAFYRIPEPDLVRLLLTLHEEASRRQLVYLRDGEVDPIRVMACPLTVLPDQLSYIHYVTQTLQNALKRLPELYMQDFAVRDILRLSPPEEQWLWECWGPAQRESNPLFGRYDAVVDFLSPMWKESLRFVEPNMSGIGGLHLVPAAENLLADIVLPLLRAQDPELRLEVGQDIRDLLIQDLLDHLESLGRASRTICFLEPKYSGSGPDEQHNLLDYYRQRYGLKLLHADPRELKLRNGQICYENDEIDLVYRDYSVYDLLELEKEGVDVSPMKVLFRENRVVSSITAELDQKSCWEVLTDPQLSQKYFSPDERQVFRRHVLWTRLLGRRETLLPDGSQGELLDYVHEERETLVLKPNRAYGGQGVLLGPALSQEEWMKAVEIALQDRERWVVQQLASIPVSEFPVLGPDGRIHTEPFYVVMGFAPSRFGLSLLGRASQKQVVNVAQRGGLCVVLEGHAPGRLFGPGGSSSLPG